MKYNGTIRLLRDEKGSSSLEFVLWVPLFAFLLMLTANASFAYMDLTRMQNVARDGARRIAMGQYDTTTIVAYIRGELPNGDYVIDTSCSTSDYACVNVTRSSDSMLPFTNFLGVGDLLGRTLGSAIKMRYEPGVTTSDAGTSQPPQVS